MELFSTTISASLLSTVCVWLQHQAVSPECCPALLSHCEEAVQHYRITGPISPMQMVQEMDTGSDTPHFPEPRVDNNSQETMAALHGLEHHNQRETVLADPADEPILRRM